MCLLQMFSSSLACLLIFLTFSLTEHKSLIFINFFLSWIMLLVLYLKCHHHTQRHLSFLLCYLLTFKSLSLDFAKCAMSVYRFHFFFFACTWLVVPAPFLERLSLLHCVIFITLSKIIWLYLCGYISGLYSVSFIYLCILSPIPSCLDYSSFTVIIKLGSISLLTLFLSFKILLAILGLSPLHINFRISLSISTI